VSEFNTIFKTEAVAKDSLSEEEAVAAIALIAAAANYSEVDVETLENLLLDFEIFADYTEDEVAEMVDKLAAIAEAESLAFLFASADEALSDDVIFDAYAAAVAILVENGTLPNASLNFLEELQQALQIDDEEAQEIRDDIIAELYPHEDEENHPIADPQLSATIVSATVESDLDIELYQSPAGNFNVPVPVDSHQGGKIDAQEGSVIFSDDLGKLLRIDYYSLTIQADEDIESLGEQTYLKSFLDKYVAQAIVANLPGSEVLHQDYLEDIMHGAYFVVVDMPKGSTISKQTSNGTMTRLDAYRGLVSFLTRDFLYTISCQRHFWEEEIPDSLDAEIAGILHKIEDFIDSIEFIED
jgi:hypothetical protein